jgi:hypothetical protein
MGNINLARVVLGGLVAGLVLNIGEFILNTYVVAEQSRAAMQRLGLAEIGMQQIVWFLIIGFVFGIWLIWVYAAIRPRLGAGIKTAIIAGLALWVVAALLNLGNVIAGVMPSNLATIGIVWALFEFVIAAIVGAWLYQERAAAAM